MHGASLRQKVLRTEVMELGKSPELAASKGGRGEHQAGSRLPISPRREAIIADFLGHPYTGPTTARREEG